MAILSSPGKSGSETLSLIVGLIGIISSLLFFLQRYGIISIAYEFSGETKLMFFAVMTLLSGIVMLLSTIGMFGFK